MIFKTYCEIISNLQKATSILQRLTPTSPLPRFSNCPISLTSVYTHTHTEPLVFLCLSVSKLQIGYSNIPSYSSVGVYFPLERHFWLRGN